MADGAFIGGIVRDLYGARLTCKQPFPLYRPGEHQKPALHSGRVDRYCVPCGRCKTCVANRKATWTGRLVAEALDAASVSFVTLTYAEDPGGFCYEHVQQMLKRFRESIDRKHGVRVRFFCVGERGELRGRVHWHILFFFDRPYKIPFIPEGEKWEFWDHGWTSAWDVPREEHARRARYCAKYCVKDINGKPSVMRCSLKPGIGMEYLKREGKRLAEAGLVPRGEFTVPGVYARNGKLWQHKLSGACALTFIEAWEDEWVRRYPERPYPSTPFLRNYDPNYVEPKPRSRLDWRTIADRNTVRVSERSSSVVGEAARSAASKMIWVGREVAHLYVDASGRAAVDVGGIWYGVEDSVGDALSLDPQDVADLDQWLRWARGPDFSWERINGEVEEQARETRNAWRDCIAAEDAYLRSSESGFPDPNLRAEAVRARSRFEEANRIARLAGPIRPGDVPGSAKGDEVGAAGQDAGDSVSVFAEDHFTRAAVPFAGRGSEAQAPY